MVYPCIRVAGLFALSRFSYIQSWRDYHVNESSAINYKILTCEVAIAADTPNFSFTLHII